MTKIMQLAAERDLLTRIEVDYSAARYAKDYDEIKASVEELEAFVMHSDFPFIRNRAQKMIDQAFDPMQH